MKVVILCGGKGTRIRDVADNIPKPMINIGDSPIVKHIMEIYSHQGYNDFVLCLGFKAWKFKEYFLNLRTQTSDIAIDFKAGDMVEYLDNELDCEWNIIFAQTGIESMTGSRIKKVEKYIGNETFMLTYGDGLGNIKIDELLEFHKSHGKLATITSVHPPSRFGELTLDSNRVTSFEEKPQTSSGRINGGFFVCESGVFDYLAEDSNCTFEREPLQNLAADGELMTYFHDDFWMPMDTMREYQLLNQLWNSGKPPWQIK